MTTNRLTGHALRQARAAWTPALATGRVICPRCRQPITPTQAWDLGHTTDLALGGDPASTVPEHRSCNRAAGARLGNDLRRARTRRRRLAQWLSFFERPNPRATPTPPIFPTTRNRIRPDAARTV